MAKATFAAGCFWSPEEVFARIDGVTDTAVGYAGSTKDNPTYEEVCTGRTGHAEAVEVTFDPAKVTYEDLLKVFWEIHDPTTANRQGPDVGSQYRSAIFAHDEQQRAAAESSRDAQQQARHDSRKIVTEITAASTFYRAQQDHQDYYRQNKNQGYCRMVIQPKLEKLGLEY